MIDRTDNKYARILADQAQSAHFLSRQQELSFKQPIHLIALFHESALYVEIHNLIHRTSPKYDA